ncbi:MAG: transglycosylase SLT domain-containing protein [Oscillospiraceae bacterium]
MHIKFTKQEIGFIAITILLGCLSIFVLVGKSLELEQHDKQFKKIIKEAVTEKVQVAEPKKVYYDIPLSEQMQDYTFEMCNKYKVSPEIIFAIMWRESRYDFEAYNKGCIGIMQIKLKFWKDEAKLMGLTDLYNPYQNIEAGVYILSKHFNKYGDYEKSLVCYQNGDKGGKGINSNKYSRDVINYANGLEVKS